MIFERKKMIFIQPFNDNFLSHIHIIYYFISLLFWFSYHYHFFFYKAVVVK